MPCDAVICDWNGTIIGYRDEKPILETIATGLFRAAMPFRPLRIVRMIRAQRELEKLYRGRHCEGDADFVREMFRVFNGKIVAGAPVSVVHRWVDRHAADPQTQAKLDHRILRPIGEAHQ